MSSRKATGSRAIVFLIAAVCAPVAAPQTRIPDVAVGGTGGADLPPPGCRIFPSPLARLEPVWEFSWYGTAADVRGGALCRFSIGPDLPPRLSPQLFYLDADERFDEFRKIRVDGIDGGEIREIQSIRLPPTIAPPPGVDYLRVDDVNFDGYRDLGLLVDYTPPDNRWYQYLLFDPRSGTFHESPDPARLVNPTIAARAREVVTRSTDGFGGEAYTRRRYRFEAGGLALVGEERQRAMDGRFVRVVSERKNGTLEEVSRTVVPVTARAPYDRSQWKVVKHRAVGLGRSLPRARVLLLQSRWFTGASSLGDPLRDVNLVIAVGDRALYRFRAEAPRFKEESDLRFALSDSLVARDVTGDGVPEIIFRTGFQAVSNWVEQHHVIHYDPRRREFRDVAREDFESGYLESLTWLRVGEAEVALLAYARWAHGECHTCEHFYKYRAYCWSEERGAFRRVYRGGSRKRYGDDGPLREELPLILPDIQRAGAGSCHREAPSFSTGPAEPTAQKRLVTIVPRSEIAD